MTITTTSTPINPPMSLPWHARKAGVSIERTTELWQTAALLAAQETGLDGGADYWAVANEQLLRLLNEEKNAFYAPKLVPLLRSQNRLMRLPLTAMEDMLTAMSANWQQCRKQCLKKLRKAA